MWLCINRPIKAKLLWRCLIDVNVSHGSGAIRADVKRHYSLTYKLKSNRLVGPPAPATARFMSFCRLVHVFGLKSQLSNRSESNGVPPDSNHRFPLLRGHCEVDFTPFTVKVGGALWHDDIFFMRALLELLCATLEFDETTSPIEVTDISYDLTMVCGARDRDRVGHHLMCSAEWTNGAQGWYERSLYRAAHRRAEVRVRPNREGVQVFFSWVHEEQINPALALEMSENRLWSAVESLGILRPSEL